VVCCWASRLTCNDADAPGDYMRALVAEHRVSPGPDARMGGLTRRNRSRRITPDMEIRRAFHVIGFGYGVVARPSARGGERQLWSVS
jgi:hypothetical protein